MPAILAPRGSVFGQCCLQNGATSDNQVAATERTTSATQDHTLRAMLFDKFLRYRQTFACPGRIRIISPVGSFLRRLSGQRNVSLSVPLADSAPSKVGEDATP